MFGKRQTGFPIHIASWGLRNLGKILTFSHDQDNVQLQGLRNLEDAFEHQCYKMDSAVLRLLPARFPESQSRASPFLAAFVCLILQLSGFRVSIDTLLFLQCGVSSTESAESMFWIEVESQPKEGAMVRDAAGCVTTPAQ